MYEDSPVNRERTRRLCAEFKQRFEGDPLIVRAPGRVNLIGEHTDYNDGFVLPIAIDHDVRIAACRRPDRIVCLHSLDYNAESTFDLDAIERDDANPWANYVRGMAVELLKQGLMLWGMNAVIEGNVPIASGLSSSAAMEIAAGVAFTAISTANVEPPCMAEMAQRAENEYMGVRVGIMDQFASRMGHPDHALFLDCRTLEYDLVPVPASEHVFIAANSLQSRELAGSAYNERRAQCEAAVEVLQRSFPDVRALRDVTLEQLEAHQGDLDPTVYRRARHVISENGRVLEAVEALRSGELERFGQLMNASHDSLRDDYEVSSPGLDTLVEAARAVDGCLGSRLTGAGFGGCTVSLVRKERVDAFCGQVRERYQREHGIDAQFYVTRPAAGAGLLQAPSSSPHHPSTAH